MYMSDLPLRIGAGLMLFGVPVQRGLDRMWRMLERTPDSMVTGWLSNWLVAWFICSTILALCFVGNVRAHVMGIVLGGGALSLVFVVALFISVLVQI